MKMLGQRWHYRIGNNFVNVDNAFSWLGWAQERLIINDEFVQQAGAWFGMRRSFDEAWLSSIDDAELNVKMISTISGIACKVKMSGKTIEPEELFSVSWTGLRGLWPPEQDWTKTEAFLWDTRKIKDNGVK